MVDSHKVWAGIGLAIAVVILGVLFFTFYSSEKAIFGKAVDTGYTERGIVMNPVIEELRTVYDTDRDGLSNNVDPDDDDVDTVSTVD